MKIYISWKETPLKFHYFNTFFLLPLGCAVWIIIPISIMTTIKQFYSGLYPFFILLALPDLLSMLFLIKKHFMGIYFQISSSIIHFAVYVSAIEVLGEKFQTGSIILEILLSIYEIMKIVYYMRRRFIFEDPYSLLQILSKNDDSDSNSNL